MKVVQVERDERSVTLEVTATEQEVSRAFEVAEINFCQAMGVRMDSNKSLAQSASEQMGISNLDMLVNQQAVDALVPMAIDKHDIYPAFMPSVQSNDLAMRGKPFKFSVKVVLKPAFELASYDPVQISVYPYEGDDSVVEAQLADLAKRGAEYIDIDEKRPVAQGDAINLSLVCKQNGKEIGPLPPMAAPTSWVRAACPRRSRPSLSASRLAKRKPSPSRRRATTARATRSSPTRRPSA